MKKKFRKSRWLTKGTFELSAATEAEAQQQC